MILQRIQVSKEQFDNPDWTGNQATFTPLKYLLKVRYLTF